MKVHIANPQMHEHKWAFKAQIVDRGRLNPKDSSMMKIIYKRYECPCGKVEIRSENV